MKVKVNMQTYANLTMNVELADDELEEIAASLEKDVADLTEDDIGDAASEKAFQEGTPGLCIHCVGMGYGSTWSLDLDEYELAQNSPIEITER